MGGGGLFNMILNYKTYESIASAHRVGMVGLPSGEYLELDPEQFVDINNSGYLTYDTRLKSFTFNDKDYNNIIYYLKSGNTNKIKKFLEAINVKKYTIKDDYTVDVFEDVKMRLKLKNFPINFGYIDGDFDCSGCNLTTLIGSPDEITGNFICTNNDLTDLRYGPRLVSGNYDVRQSKLHSLEGSPAKIYKNFICSYNNITTLVGSPVIIEGSMDCSNCLLEDLNGSPDIIGLNFDCSYNFLKSLKDGPDMINGIYDCSYNELLNLKDGPSSARVFKCTGNKLKDLTDAPIDSDEIIDY